MTSRTRLRVVVAAVLVAGVLAAVAVFAPSLLSPGGGELDRDAAQSATVQRVNEFRTGQGRAALSPAPRLDEVALNRSAGGDARANCSATVLTATIQSPSGDETRLAGQFVEGLTENADARARLLDRGIEEIGVGFDGREDEVHAAVVLC